MQMILYLWANKLRENIKEYFRKNRYKPMPEFSPGLNAILRGWMKWIGNDIHIFRHERETLIQRLWWNLKLLCFILYSTT